MPTKPPKNRKSPRTLEEVNDLRARLRESATFPRDVIAEIQRAAATGIYDIRGFGAKRRIPNFDDLVFLGASMSRYPLEGYREACDTHVTIGERFAKKPIELKIPITIAGIANRLFQSRNNEHPIVLKLCHTTNNSVRGVLILLP